MKSLKTLQNLAKAGKIISKILIVVIVTLCILIGL